MVVLGRTETTTSDLQKMAQLLLKNEAVMLLCAQPKGFPILRWSLGGGCGVETLISTTERLSQAVARSWA